MQAASSRSPLCRKYWPPRPGQDEKHIDPSTPLTFMSRMRSSTSHVPLRTSSKHPGSLPHSSRTRPATALRPKLETSLPSISQASVPLGRWITRGTRSRYLAGKWSMK